MQLRFFKVKTLLNNAFKVRYMYELFFEFEVFHGEKKCKSDFLCHENGRMGAIQGQQALIKERINSSLQNKCTSCALSTCDGRE